MNIDLNIQIEGIIGSGKSAVAHAIKNALIPFGVEVEISGCEDEKPGVLERDWEERLKFIGPELKVNIKTKRTVLRLV